MNKSRFRKKALAVCLSLFVAMSGFAQEDFPFECENLAEALPLWEQIDSLSKKGDFEACIPLQWEIVALNKSAGRDICQLVIKSEIASTLISNTQYDEALKHINRTLTEIEHIDERDLFYLFLGRLLNDKGLVYYYTSNFEEAATNYLQALEAYQEVKTESTSLHNFRAGTYVNLGGAYKELERWEEAIESLEKGRKIKLTLFGPSSEKLTSTFQVLGMCYHQLRDFDKALAYHKQVLNLTEAHRDSTHTHIGIACINLGQVYYQMKNYEEALKYASRAKDLWLNNYGKYYRYTGIAYNEIGNCYGRLKAYEKQLESYLLALEIQEKVLGANHPSLYKHKLNLGNCYGLLGEIEKQFALYQEVMRYHLKYSPSSDVSLLSAREKLAAYYLEHRAYQKAIHQADSMMMALSSSNTPFSLHELPPYASIALPASYFSALNLKAQSTLGQFSLGEKSIEEGQKNFEMAIAFLDSMLMRFRGKNTQRVLTEKAIPLFEGAISLELAAYAKTSESSHLEQAFYFAEKSRSVLLRRFLQDAKARDFSGIPEKILADEKRYRQQFNSLEERLYKLEASQSDLDQVKEIRSQYLYYKELYVNLLQEIEEKFPAYYHLKFSQKATDMHALQAYAGKQAAQILSYFWGEKHVFLFEISQDHVACHVLDSAHLIQHNLEELIKATHDVSALQQDQGYQENISHFTSSSHILFQQLLGKVTLNKKRLIIIPDGPLGYLPFGLLLSESTHDQSFRDFPYLLKSHQIVYNYSAQILIEKHPKKEKSPQTYAGFAPSFSVPLPYPDLSNLRGPDRGNLAPLLFNKKEVQAAAQVMKGQTFIGETCDEKLFKEKAGDFQILHVATHAFVNDQNPLYSGLIFNQIDSTHAPIAEIEDTSEGILYAYEIYKLSLQAELLVLSACHTGQGKLARGEGIMSLDRAFRYAGCQSILTSLWQANDQVTYKLMNIYFQKLAEGMEKDEALRQAKLTFIKQASPLEAFPHYWAGFIQIGDIAPIPRPKTNNWTLWIGIFLVFSIFLYFYWQKSQNN